MALPKNYKRGIDYLNKNFPFFTVLVTNLGRPVVNNTVTGHLPEDTEYCDKGEPIYQVPTLQVQKNIDEDEFQLHLNEKFLAPLTDEEIAAVLSHEAYHIIFSHLAEMTTPFALEVAEEMLPKKATKHQIEARARTLVILAHECICNDNVVNEGMSLPDLRRVSKITGKLGGGLKLGPEVVKRSVAYYTTDEVVELLRKKRKDEQENDEDEFEKEMQQMDQGGGNDHYIEMTPEDLKNLQDILEKKARHAVFDGTVDANDIQSDDLKNILKIKQTSSKAGSGSSKAQADFKKKGLGLNWFKYLRRLDPSAFRDGGTMGDFKTSWHAPRRKLAHLYPKVNLPVYAPRYSKNNIGSLRPQIVLALDFSGSIPREMATVMGNLARAVPEGIDVHCCTFSDDFVPFNHKLDGEQDVASGGTDFSAIQAFINTLDLKRQPNVVVITDGEAGWRHVQPSKGALEKKWNWLLIDRSNRVHAPGVNPDSVEFLQDYLAKK
jgi:hypothetical protein